MTRRTLSLFATLIAVAVPAAALAAWTGAPANPPSSNTNGPVWSQSTVTAGQAGDAAFTSGRAIQAYTSGIGALNFGNWAAGATGFFAGIYGHLNMYPANGSTTAPILNMAGQSRLNVYQICLTGDICRTSWPAGGGGGGSGVTTSSADARYVQKAGDTMTGVMNHGTSGAPINTGGAGQAVYVHGTWDAIRVLSDGASGVYSDGAQYGIIANATNGNGTGVRGVGGTTGYGGYFTVSGNGVALHGDSAGGEAVQGFAGATAGGIGGHFDGAGRGVWGTSTNNEGVRGDSTNSNGVIGTGGGTGRGVWGISNGTGDAIRGDSTNGSAVVGVSANAWGVYGQSTNSYGVLGIANSNAGVGGIFYNNATTINAQAVIGIADASVNGGGYSGSVGVRGQAANGTGVIGNAANQKSSGVSGFGFYGVQGNGLTGVRGDGTSSFGVEGYGPTAGVFATPNTNWGDAGFFYAYQAPGVGNTAAGVHAVGGVRRAIYAESFGNSSTTTAPTIQVANTGTSGVGLKVDQTGLGGYGLDITTTNGGTGIRLTTSGVNADGIWSQANGTGAAYAIGGSASQAGSIGGYFQRSYTGSGGNPSIWTFGAGSSQGAALVVLDQANGGVGVKASAGDNGIAVYGEAGNAGAGLYGASGYTNGVGIMANSAGIGIAATGTRYGIQAGTASPAGTGVSGYVGNFSALGFPKTGIGVDGFASGGVGSGVVAGVAGRTDVANAYGIMAQNGAYGTALTASGGYTGVYGSGVTAGSGIGGEFHGWRGVIGVTSDSAAGSAGGWFSTYTSTANAIDVSVGNILVENGSITIAGSGSLGIQVSDPGSSAAVNLSYKSGMPRIRYGGTGGATGFQIQGQGDAMKLGVDDNGNLTISGNTATKGSGTTWVSASDVRLKDIHGSFTHGLSDISKLNPVYFNYKKDNAAGLDSSVEHAGFIAQEVQKLIPEAVSKRSDGYLQLDADPILWSMVNAIKELKIENDSLKSENASLKSALDGLVKRVDKLEAAQQ